MKKDATAGASIASRAQMEGMAASSIRGSNHFRAQTVLYVLIMCLGSISYAYSAGIISNLLAQPSFYLYMQLTPANSAPLLGAVASLYYVGGVFGAIAGHVSADHLGRKKTMMVGSIILLVATALCAGSVHIAMFIVFRFVSGFGSLMLAMCVPLWITECVPPEVRGALAQFHGVAINTGYLLASYIGVAFYLHVNPDSLATWRGQAAIGVVPIVCLLVGLYWVPESPRYLLMRGKEKEARDIVINLHSSAGDTRFAEMELFQMKQQIEFDRSLSSSWIEIFRKPSLRKRAGMTFFVVFSILSTGNLVIVLFATQMFKNLGFDTTKQQLLQAGELAAVTPGICLAVFWTEKFQRNRMVATGMVILAIVLSCYTAVTAQFINDIGNRSAQIAGVALLFIYLVFSAAILEGPNAYYTTEFWPTHLRAKGQTINMVTYCVVSILWTQLSGTAIENIGWKYYLVFICITCVTAPIIFFFFPNTQGKTLEEVALLFGDVELVVVRQEDIIIDEAGPTIRGKVHVHGGPETEFIEQVA